MSRLYAIGQSEFQANHGTIQNASGLKIELRAKAVAVLEYLASRADQVVSREELLDAVWPSVHVTENNLSQCVAEIRRAIGDDKARLRTVPRRGYVLSATPIKTDPKIPQSGTAVPVLAVLPFSVRGLDAQLSSFADILLDCIVNALCTLREPVVISTNSTRKFDPGVDPASAGLQVGSHYITTGRIHRLGECIRLSIELVETASGTILWQHEEGLCEATLFQVPSRLAIRIARIFVPHIRASELRQARRRPQDATAYQLVLDAQCLMLPLNPASSFQRAKQLLEKAVSLDPSFAMPHAVLGNWYSLWIGQQWSQDVDSDTKSLNRELRLALELDPGNARALALLGHSHTILLREYDIALELISRSQQTAPNDAETCLWSSPTLMYIGLADEALIKAEQALKLSPTDPLIFRYQHFLSIAHYGCGNYEEAAKEGLRSFRSNNRYTSNWFFTVAALGALGRRKEAKPLVNRCLHRFPHYRAHSSKAPFKNRSMWKQYVGHLIAAGLPA